MKFALFKEKYLTRHGISFYVTYLIVSLLLAVIEVANRLADKGVSRMKRLNQRYRVDNMLGARNVLEGTFGQGAPAHIYHRATGPDRFDLNKPAS